MIVFDCEIKKAIPGPNVPHGITCCDGWEDFGGMGIACVCVYDYGERRYRVFCEDNLSDFQDLIHNRNLLIGFNSVRFDNKLLSVNGVDVGLISYYDIYYEIMRGLGVHKQEIKPAGYKLDQVCEINFGHSKTEHGAMAPVYYQQGKIGRVIDYCLNDVYLTVRLFNKIMRDEYILDPVNKGKVIFIDPPKRSFR